MKVLVWEMILQDMKFLKNLSLSLFFFLIISTIDMKEQSLWLMNILRTVAGFK